MKSLTVADAISSRMSVRAFTTEPVSKETITKLLNLSARAPSGTNTQPWKAFVLEGKVLKELCAQVCAAYDAVAVNPELAKEYDPYINCMTLPQWSSRGYRVKPGQKSLRSIVMIEKKDKNGEVISSFPRNIFLFFYPQVKRLPNYGNN